MPIDVELDLRVYSSATVILVCILQLGFYYTQRLNGRCGWEVIYVAAVEPLTYLLSLLFADQTVVPIGEDGLPFAWLRYGGWLCTCPVLLLNLTNLPKGRKFKSPMATLGALVLDQVMIVAGVSAIFYKGIAKAALFAVGLLAGAALFRIAFSTFQRASESYPEHARSWLWGVAAIFFSSWCLFPILWLLGPEGSGVISVEDSLVMHAVADLVSKNMYSGMAWWLKWVVLDTKPLAFARKNNEAKKGTKGSKSLSYGDSGSGSKTGRKSARSRSRDRADRVRQLAIESYDQRSLPASEDDDYMGDEATGEFAYLEDIDSDSMMSERAGGFDDPFAQRQAMALIESILNEVRDFDHKHALSIALVTRSVPDAKQVVEGVDRASRGTASVSVQADLLGYAKMVWTGQGKACGHIVLVSPEILEWLAVATEAEMSASGVVQHTKKGSRIGNGTAQAPAADMSQVYLHAIDEDRSLPSFEDRRIPAWEDSDTAAKVRERLVGVFGSRPVVCLLGGETNGGAGGADGGKDGNSDRRRGGNTPREGPQSGDRRVGGGGRGRVTRADAMLCGCVDVVRSSDEQEGLRALLRSAQQHIAGCVFEVAEGKLRALLQRQLLAFRQGGMSPGYNNGYLTAGGASDSIASRAFADDQSKVEMGWVAGRPAIGDVGQDLGAAQSSWLGGGSLGMPGAKAGGGVRAADWTTSPADTTGPSGFAAGQRNGKGRDIMGAGPWNEPIYSDSEDEEVMARFPFSTAVGVSRNDDASGIGSGAKRQVLDRLRDAQDALRQQEQLQLQQYQEQLRSTPRGGMGMEGGEDYASDVDESPARNMRRDDDDDDGDEPDGIGDVLVQDDEDDEEEEESKRRGEDEHEHVQQRGSGIQRGVSSRSRSSRRGSVGNIDVRRGRSISTRGRREQERGSRMLPGSDDEDERDRSRRRSRTPQPLQQRGMGSGLKSGRRSRRGSITSLRGGRRGPARLETPGSSSRRGLVQGSPRVARSVMGDMTRSRMLGGSDSQSVY